MAQGTRNREEIEAEIAAARQRLSTNVEGLITQAHPKAVAARTMYDAKTLLAAEVQGVKEQFFEPSGAPRTTRIAALAAMAVGTVALLVLLRGAARRR
ncbi:MAG: DUF3618 domain-containing protein [Propioniciclava sp.]